MSPSARPTFFAIGAQEALYGPVSWSPMTDQPQWKVTLREDADGTKIVEFSFEGERGHIQMEASAGILDPADLDDALADEIRRRAKSCVISWRDDAGFDRAMEVRVVSRSILVYKLNGDVLALGDRVEEGIGEQDPEWLISHVRSLVLLSSG